MSRLLPPLPPEVRALLDEERAPPAQPAAVRQRVLARARATLTAHPDPAMPALRQAAWQAVVPRDDVHLRRRRGGRRDGLRAARPFRSGSAPGCSRAAAAAAGSVGAPGRAGR